MRKRTVAMLLCCLTLTFGGCGNSEIQEVYDAGMEALEAGEYETAIEDFTQVTESGERLSESYRGMGLAYMELESYPEAIAAFSRALNYMENEDKDFEKDVSFYLARARMDNGNVEKAIEVYTDILEDGWDAQALFLRAKAYIASGDYEKAGEDFDSALKNNKDYDLFINIYQIYVSCGREADGSAYLEQALAMEPETGEDYYQRARIYEYQKDYTAAKEALISAMDLDYDDAMLLLGRIYLESDDPASARSMYKEYLDESDNDARAYNGLAMCDIYEESYESALQYVQLGIAENDESEMQGLLYNEITVYEYLKDFDTAKEKMKTYLEQYPDDEDAIRENIFLSTR